MNGVQRWLARVLKVQATVNAAEIQRQRVVAAQHPCAVLGHVFTSSSHGALWPDAQCLKCFERYGKPEAVAAVRGSTENPW